MFHVGNVTMPASARADFETAAAYLRADPLERALFDRLEHGTRHFRLVTNRHDADYYDPATRTIHWDPHSALATSCGGRQSPALGLAHEVDHAVEDPRTEARLATTPDPNFDSAEERRVITGSERHAARTLGESVRHDHTGDVYRVDSPTALLVG